MPIRKLTASPFPCLVCFRPRTDSINGQGHHIALQHLPHASSCNHAIDTHPQYNRSVPSSPNDAVNTIVILPPMFPIFSRFLSSILWFRILVTHLLSSLLFPIQSLVRFLIPVIHRILPTHTTPLGKYLPYKVTSSMVSFQVTVALTRFRCGLFATSFTIMIYAPCSYSCR